MTPDQQASARVVEGRLRDVIDEVSWHRAPVSLQLAKILINVIRSLSNKTISESALNLAEKITGRVMIIVYPDGECEYHMTHDTE